MGVATRRGGSSRPSRSTSWSRTPRTGHSSLKRAVGLLDLTALGIGAIIGTGIFVIIGEAIGDSGPAIMLSFVLAGVTCMFSALSYAELASTIPVSGSAYTYAYATLGELVAWIIGWDLILEYGVSVAAVAVGWGSTSTSCWTRVRLLAARRDRQPPGDGGIVNLPAVVHRARGRRAADPRRAQERAREHDHGRHQARRPVLFIALAFTRRSTSGNLTPFSPHGFDGVVDRGVGDLLRLHRLRRDLDRRARRPRTRSATCRSRSSARCVICTVLYILVALVGDRRAAATTKLNGAGGAAGRGDDRRWTSAWRRR